MCILFQMRFVVFVVCSEIYVLQNTVSRFKIIFNWSYSIEKQKPNVYNNGQFAFDVRDVRILNLGRTGSHFWRVYNDSERVFYFQNTNTLLSFVFSILKHFLKCIWSSISGTFSPSVLYFVCH